MTILVKSTGPLRLVSMTCHHPSLVVKSNVSHLAITAEKMIQSIEPNSFSTISTSRSLSANLLTSVCTPIALTPNLSWASRAAESASDFEISAKAMRLPSCAKARPAAFPRPLPPPVTRTTFSENSSLENESGAMDGYTSVRRGTRSSSVMMNPQQNSAQFK